MARIENLEVKVSHSNSVMERMEVAMRELEERTAQAHKEMLQQVEGVRTNLKLFAQALVHEVWKEKEKREEEL